MSMSMAEYAQEAAVHAALLKHVADRFPGARMEVLWDDGPQVIVVSENAEATAAADRVMCLSLNKEPHLIPYFVLEKDEHKLAVFVTGHTWSSAASAFGVLEQLRKNPEVYAAIVAAVKEYM